MVQRHGASHLSASMMCRTLNKGVAGATSGGKVQFSSVQRAVFLNLELN